jgi:uncharacterized protein YjbI with pentapeptide repeats
MSENVKTENSAGSSLLKLQQAVAQVNYFSTSAIIEFDARNRPAALPGSTARVTVIASPRAIFEKPKTLNDLLEGSNLRYMGPVDEGLKIFADFCKDGKLRCESISAESRSGPFSALEIKKLAIAAWCEIFAVPVPSDNDLNKATADRQDAEKKEAEQGRLQFLEMLRSGPDGVREASLHAGLKFDHVDFQGTDLTSWRASRLTFQSSNFDEALLFKAAFDACDMSQSTFRRARMESVSFKESKFVSCDFSGASFINARSIHGNFAKAIFHDVDFSGARLVEIDLRGADLSSAKLDKSYFSAKCDEETKWPDDFVPRKNEHELQWKGKGKDPRRIRNADAAVPQAPTDFASFLVSLEKNCEKKRLKNVFKMLKTERFQLFAELSSNAVNGIVKSQTDPDLVYSCRLAEGGIFHCCTQNLRACGGLRGELCKHLLVLLIGLTKAGEIDPTAACKWVVESLPQEPKLDKEIATGTFMRYQGKRAGEIDWRPTETIPEDYFTY